MKIVTDIKFIHNIDKRTFRKTEKNGHISSWRFSNDELCLPFNLLIEKNRDRQELVLEFSGKILLDDYPSLISMDTIRNCFENIYQLGVCKLDVDAIVHNSRVVKCDVTHDVSYNDLKSLNARIMNGITNHKKYICKQNGDNLIINNSVSTSNLKIRMVIYDKDKEMGMSCNHEFLDMINNPENMLGYFKGKKRFELNLNSVLQIKKRLKVKDNTLIDVLQSKASPILDFLNEVIPIANESKDDITTLRDYERCLLLDQCHNNLAEVEQIVRKYTSPKASIKQRMEPYKQLLQLRQKSPGDVHSELVELLSESV